MKRNSLKNSLFFFLFFLFAFWTGELTAQKHIAIDSKGTLKEITSSQVSTTVGVTPLNPNEGDVWIDTASNTVKIWEESAVPAWREVASIRNWISLSNSGVYGIDHLVSYNGSIYKNLTGTNSDTFPNLDVTNWKSIGGGDIVPLWKSTTSGGSYATNDIINYNGTLYKNTTGTNSDTTPDLDTTNWINLEQITKVSGEFIREGDLIKAVGLESVTGGTVVFVEGTDPALPNIELAFDGDNETFANLYLSSFSRHNYELPSVLNVSKVELNYSSPADSSNVIIRLLDATDTILEEIMPPELLASQGTVKLKYEMNVSGVAKVQIFDPTGSRTNINEISLYTLENSLAIPNVDIGDTLYLEDYGYTTLLSNLDGNVTLRATSSNEVPRWVSNTNGGTYNTESIINHQGTLYKNLTGTNSDTTPDADATNWESIGGGDIVPLWKSITSGGSYATNDIINYDGTLYKNLTGTNTDTTPDADTINWEIASSSGEAGLSKQYLVAKYSGSSFSVTNGMTYPYNTTVSSQGDNIINNTDGTYTLKAGNTYKLTANIGRFSGTGYVAWKWYNGTDNAYIDTGSSAQQWGGNYSTANNTWTDSGIALAIVRPDVDTTVYLRQSSGTTSASMSTESVYGTARMYIEVLETSSIGGTGLATYDINRDYQLNDSIEKDGIIYKANGTIPAGTPFAIGTTGATWTALTTAAVQGTKYQYLVAKYSGSSFSITNGMTYPYNTTIESEGTSISQSGGVFTLKAGNTYKLTADIGRFSGTGYVSWKWYNGTTNSFIDTSSSADQWGGKYATANNTWTDSGTAHAMITPDVDTEVYLKQNSGTTTATQNTEGSFGTARVFVELLSTPVNKNLTDTNEVATDETYNGKIVYRQLLTGTTSADGSGVVLLNNISWLVRSEGRVSRAVGAFQQWHDISLVKTLNPDVHVDPVFYSEGPNDIRLLIGSGTEYHSRPYKLTLWYTKL